MMKIKNPKSSDKESWTKISVKGSFVGHGCASGSEEKNENLWHWSESNRKDKAGIIIVAIYQDDAVFQKQARRNLDYILMLHRIVLFWTE